MVSVLGDHYKYKFTKEELFKLTSKINTIKSAPLAKGDSNKSALQSHLIIEPSSNYLRFNIDSCTVTINFDQPVLKLGDEDFRPYIECGCCGCPSCDQVNVPSSISSILNNITSASQCTLFGQPPNFFQEEDGFVEISWYSDVNGFYADFLYAKGDSCIRMNYGVTPDEGEPSEAITFSGYGCPGSEYLVNTTDFTINNVTLPAVYYYPIQDHPQPSSKASFVFTALPA
jgi:hypothetical protein